MNLRSNTGRLFWHDPHDDVATMAVSSSTLSSLIGEVGKEDKVGDLTVEMMSSMEELQIKRKEKVEKDDEEEEEEERAKERGIKLREAFYRNVAIMSGEESTDSNTVIGRFSTMSSNKTIDFTISKGKDGDVTTVRCIYYSLESPPPHSNNTLECYENSIEHRAT